MVEPTVKNLWLSISNLVFDIVPHMDRPAGDVRQRYDHGEHDHREDEAIFDRRCPAFAFDEPLSGDDVDKPAHALPQFATDSPGQMCKAGRVNK